MLGRRDETQGDMPRRRTRAALGRTPRTDSERIAAVAHDAHVPVEEVLKDVADFRLALETDMIIAAAAADAGAPDLLADVVDEERLELATFHDRLLERLADAAADDELAVRRARKAPRAGRVSRFVAVAAAAVAVFGAGRAMTGDPAGVGATSNVAAIQTANQQYADLSRAVNGTSRTSVSDAAQQLHDTLEQLISDHAGDPEVAHRAAQLLLQEISLLRQTDPDGASHVLAQARTLVTMLERAAPPKVLKSVQPVLDAAAPPKPRTKPKASASPTQSPTPSPTPSPKASASATADPDGSNNPLDNAP
ncbi:MAG TPA: hypothetical protein VNQ77_08095 [Frankiaceae bacterium]|nr:hypothetical protein [Frankiaceae bacterium]